MKLILSIPIFITVLLVSYFPTVSQSSNNNSLQVDSTNIKAKNIAKKNLTYLWYGRYCPSDFKNMKYKYGFKIRCVGCVVTGHIHRHNDRVVRKINRVYGKGWFEENKVNFINT
jgi:hypothetical protein